MLNTHHHMQKPREEYTHSMRMAGTIKSYETLYGPIKFNDSEFDVAINNLPIGVTKIMLQVYVVYLALNKKRLLQEIPLEITNQKSDEHKYKVNISSLKESSEGQLNLQKETFPLVKFEMKLHYADGRLGEPVTDEESKYYVLFCGEEAEDTFIHNCVQSLLSKMRIQSDGTPRKLGQKRRTDGGSAFSIPQINTEEEEDQMIEQHSSGGPPIKRSRHSNLPNF